MADDKNDFLIRIQTDAELTNLRKTLAELTELANGARDAGRDVKALEHKIKATQRTIGERKLKIFEEGLTGVAGKSKDAAEKLKLLTDTSQLSQMDKFGKELKTIADRIPVVGALTRSLNGSTANVVGFLGIIASAYKFASSALQEFEKDQKAVLSLETVLANNGQYTKAYSQELQALADTLQNKTAVAGDRWLNVLESLTGAGADATNITRYADAVKNLAGVMGGNVEQASMIFTRAMQGNFGELSRLGISFKETGDSAKDLEAFMRLCDTRGGGLLENRAKTLSSQFGLLKESVDSIYSSFGNWVNKSGILQVAIAGLRDVTDWWADALDTPVQGLNRLEQAGLRIPPVTEKIKKGIEDASKAKFDALTRETEAANAELSRQLALLKEIERQKIAMNNAQLALRLEEIESDTSLTPLEKEAAANAAKTAAAKEQFKIEQAGREEELKNLEAQKQLAEQKRQILAEEKARASATEAEAQADYNAALEAPRKRAEERADAASAEWQELLRRRAELQTKPVGVEPGDAERRMAEERYLTEQIREKQKEEHFYRNAAKGEGVTAESAAVRGGKSKAEIAKAKAQDEADAKAAANAQQKKAAAEADAKNATEALSAYDKTLPEKLKELESAIELTALQIKHAQALFDINHTVEQKKAARSENKLAAEQAQKNAEAAAQVLTETEGGQAAVVKGQAAYVQGLPTGKLGQKDKAIVGWAGSSLSQAAVDDKVTEAEAVELKRRLAAAAQTISDADMKGSLLSILEAIQGVSETLTQAAQAATAAKASADLAQQQIANSR